MTTQVTQLLFANNAASTLAAGITNIQTTAALAAGTGSLFPNPASGQGFLMTLTDAVTGLINEIVLVTGMSGDNITSMVRAQEGTSAKAWLAGDFADNLITAGSLSRMRQASNIVGGQVGSLSEGQMYLAAATATGTLTANGFSANINLGTTGVGGMDTGAAPVSGYVAVYAIANLNTGASGLLACNVTTSSGATYTGANMPAGYTVSQLMAIWPTNGSSQFVPAMMNGKHVSIVKNQILTGGAATVYTAVDLSTLVPPSAKAVDFSIGVPVTGTGSTFVATEPTAPIGEVVATELNAGGAQKWGGTFIQFQIWPTHQQSVYYKVSGAATLDMAVIGYWF